MKALIAVLAVLVLTLASGLAHPYAGGNGNEFFNNGSDMKTIFMIYRTTETVRSVNEILSNPNILSWRSPAWFILRNGQTRLINAQMIFLSHNPSFGEKVYVTNNQRLILSYTPQPGQCWTMYATQTLPTK